MKMALILGVLLLAGCATTMEKEYNVEQGTKERPISCATISSSKVMFLNGKQLSPPGGSSIWAVTLNYKKNTLYVGDSLTGYSCKKHISKPLWNCDSPLGESVISIGNDKKASYKVIGQFEYVSPKWEYTLCPE